jgi:2-polyprenyl-6-methoxyphenol hydroxylase-like FAD-dependent oxidoreductase
MRALVIGGGIGGLAAAVALRCVGLDVTLFEQAPAMRESGAGLTLWTNATRALRALGLDEPLRPLSTPLERGEVRAASGRLLAAIPLGDLGRRLGGPTVGVHRADLLALLAAAVPPAGVRLEHRLERFAQDEAGVTAHFAGGRAERGDLLVGADGIHSRVRAQLLGDPLRYAGYVGWRGVARVGRPEFPAGLSVWSYGRGSQFGLIPIGGGRVFWFGTSSMAEDEANRLGSHRDELRARFRGWHDPIPEVIEAMDEGALVRTPIYDRPPAGRWGAGRVTLLGDSAHATTPTLGQGACLAIESALVLARRLRDTSSVAAALRLYEHERQGRTARIIRQSWGMGKRIQWRHPLACRFRDLVIRAVPTALHVRTLERIIRPGCVDEGWPGAPVAPVPVEA